MPAWCIVHGHALAGHVMRYTQSNAFSGTTASSCMNVMIIPWPSRDSPRVVQAAQILQMVVIQYKDHALNTLLYSPFPEEFIDVPEYPH